MLNKKYDNLNPESIIAFARELIGKSIVSEYGPQWENPRDK
jgi:hypothetical protein